MADRPNILLLMDDEHRADVLGFAGNDIVRTPVLDGLANSGFVFNNAYTSSPVCLPARQSMMVGELPSERGIKADDLAPNSHTFARRFSEYAYATVIAGKLHHRGWDQMQGWRHRIGAEQYVWTKHLTKRDEAAFEKFDRGIEPHIARELWSAEKEIKRAGPGRPVWNVRKDEHTIEGALQYIEQHFADPYYDHAQPDRPLLLKVSLNQPHYPFIADEELFEYYLNRVDPFIETESPNHPALGQHSVSPGEDVTRREIQRATAAYYAMVETVDHHFGQVLSKLRQVGEDLDDWIIVFTSDHGEMLGEHGVWMKGQFYEGSVRVPLIIRWPNEFEGGETIEENVSLTDLYATLCDLAGIEWPADIRSRSLRPLLSGERENWTNEVIAEYYHSGRDEVMIKKDALKYQYYGDDVDEVLFDLQEDPDEMTNVINDPTYEEDIAEFRAKAAELGFA